MANDDDSELQEEIVDLLPSRFREISATSTAMERFNLLSNDLISDRIIPALHSRLRSLIPNARPGLIANRLRHLVDSAPPPARQCSLMFRLVEMGNVSEINFLDCAIRDMRLPPFPNRELERRFSPGMPNFQFTGIEYFMETIGDKIIYWTCLDARHHFCYIMNAGINTAGTFRALDISTVVGEVQDEPVSWILNAIVEDQLIVLFGTNGYTKPMLSLDLNTERWSVLPQCPWFPGAIKPTPIPWKGKLYLVDMYGLEFGKYAALAVPMHFDFQRNVWVVGDDVSNAFGRCLFMLPKIFFNYPSMGPIISSQSGTLYAVVPETDPMLSIQYPISAIYAMDDSATGWRRIKRRKSVHTKQFHPFRLPNLPGTLGVYTRINYWEINEHDILLAVLQFSFFMDGVWARYAWWTFNEDDGVKTYGGEELSNYRLQNADLFHMLVLKLIY